MRLTLGDLWAIAQMQRRVVIISIVVCVFASVVYATLATRKYTAVATVHMMTMAGQEIQADRVVDYDQYNRWNRGVWIATQLDVLESRPVREEILRRYVALGLGDGVEVNDANLRMLATSTETKIRQGTELLDIYVTTTDPERATRIANLTAHVFEDQSLNQRTDASRQSIDWLNKEISDYDERIRDASKRLLEFQRDHQMADANQQTSLGAVMGSLNEAYGDVHTERVKYETMVRDHERLLRAGDYEELAKDMNTAMIEALNQKYAGAVTNHAQVAAVYGEKMPQRRAAEAEIERIDQEIKAEVQHTLAAERAKLEQLKAKEKDLAHAIEGSKGEYLDVEASRADYEKLKLELESASAFYARLTERRGELEMQSKTQLNNIRVLEEARVPKGASAPNVPMVLAIGLGVGVLAGVGIGLLREYLDDSITSPLDVATYLRAPFLGMIPKIDDERDESRLALYTHEHPRSTVAEALRGIRTVMEMSPTSVVPRRLLVTSAVSAEGKTSTVVRLGVAFANLNRRVLMIDADLRRPRIHKVFGVDREVGLSTVLVGEKDYTEVIHPTPVPGLFFMPSGRGGERPNELLASHEVQRLLDRLGQDFDLVIIDTPPSAILSDARILSRHVDGVVMVVREQSTSRMLVREAVAGLEQVGARVLGVIVNAVDFGRRRTSYKYYYGYGYRYDKYYYGERNDAAAK
ncbi:MAG: polysaccharide biosynthesis tyrosine autokinase [Alphaproteobacteria bacterium]|nr:polysaccharide biosynthesis tyrosine autokinase [Alphaproteobacteria bacterium]MCB9697334.1 polysaccharide biosynthesis tyrosine autokinase [Alphaproteobacteria bacterium]